MKMLKMKTPFETVFIIVSAVTLVALIVLISLIGKNLTYSTRFTPPSTQKSLKKQTYYTEVQILILLFSSFLSLLLPFLVYTIFLKTKRFFLPIWIAFMALTALLLLANVHFLTGSVNYRNYLSQISKTINNSPDYCSQSLCNKISCVRINSYKDARSMSIAFCVIDLICTAYLVVFGFVINRERLNNVICMTTNQPYLGLVWICHRLYFGLTLDFYSLSKCANLQLIENIRMNILLLNSRCHTTIRGKVTQPLLFQQPSNNFLSINTSSWKLNSLNFYVQLVYQLAKRFDDLIKCIKAVKGHSKQVWDSISCQQIKKLLSEWLSIAKKMEFYRFQNNFHELYFHQNGLLSLIIHGDLRCILLISQIEKYRSRCVEQQRLSLSQLRCEEVNIIFSDVCLKISKHILTELKSQMYYPSKELVCKLLKFYGMTYNFQNTFKANYHQALQDKKISGDQDSRQSLIVFFTLKVIYSLSQLQGVCCYLSYLKNILLDRRNGILTAQYDTWALLYQTCLKLYARYEQIRVKQWLQIDQILSSSCSQPQFQHFLLKHAGSEDVSLSSINFYIKNSRKEDRQQLKQTIINKIQLIMSKQFWKYVEDIFQYIDNQMEQEQKIVYVKLIMNKTIQAISKQVENGQLYNFEYAISFIAQNCIKYRTVFDQYFNSTFLQAQKSTISSCTPNSSMVLLSYRMFNQLIANIYTEANYQNWNFPSVPLLIDLIELYFSFGYICSKSTFKLIFDRMSLNQYDEQIWDRFFCLLTEHYFIGGYDQNSDLQLIHSHQNYKEIIASKILNYFQQLISSQLSERKEVIKCLASHNQNVKSSYFGVKAYKDGLMFQSIQNICLIFNSHLSMQTLQFGLNYCTPFICLEMWKPEQQQLSLLSLISEQMPIETLKFIYKQVCQDININFGLLGQLSPTFWSHYWSSDRTELSQVMASQLNSIQLLDSLHQIRRFEFILNLSCCVFDKLNEHSQKNIKQIKIIYEQAVFKIITLLDTLRPVFFEAFALQLIHMISTLQNEEVKALPLIDQDQNSFIMKQFMAKNNFMQIAKQFNQIGVINQSNKVNQVQQALLPCFIQIKTPSSSLSMQVIHKQLELCLALQSTLMSRLAQGDNTNLSSLNMKININNDWAKQITAQTNTLHLLLKQLPLSNQLPQNWCALKDRINDHLKCLISKILLPQLMTILLNGDCKPQLARHIYRIMKGSIELIYAIDLQYEQHFIILIQKLQDIIKEVKSNSVQSCSILSLLQLFFELIFNKIRIRSYHLYRIIKYFQKLTGQGLQQFNTVIAHHIRMLFEEFITNYKNISEIQLLCGSRKNITIPYQQLNKYQHKLNYIEIACTLSMFINLFCRLNFPSLTVGIQTIFSQEQAKAIYIDYLNSLARKIATDQIQIPQRDLQILKIDVIGNLSIITKGKLSQRLLNKLVSLAKNLLRVKVDLKGANKLPIKLLADKIATQQLQVNLEQFEDECKAISLGVISMHKKLASHISSNLHLCNLHYITGKNIDKYIELNHSILLHSKQELSNQLVKIGKEGVGAVRVEIGEQAVRGLEGLVRKLEKYYQISLKDSEYVQKLYSIFKIICIACLNNPEIVSLLLSQTLTIGKQTLTFLQFVFSTLKICLPLFCQFYTTLLKTNCGFIKISQEMTVSANLQLQIQVRNRALQLFRSQVELGSTQYLFLPQAITFIQQYSETNRFRFYKFAKNSNEVYQSLLKEYQRHFHYQIIKICQQHIQNKRNSPTMCRDIYNILEITMDKYYIHNSQLDFKKLNNQEIIKKYYCAEKDTLDANKENCCESDRKSRESETAKSKVNDSQQIKPILALLMQTKDSTCFKKDKMNEKVIVKEKKPKEYKQLKLNYLQQDVIGLNDCKKLVQEWSVESPSSLNLIMVQKFTFFNQQIENRQFMKDSIVFPTKNGLQVLPQAGSNIMDCINQEQPSSKESSKQKLNAGDGIVESLDNIKQQLCDELINFSNKVIEESEPIDQIINDNDLIQQEAGTDSIIYSQIQIQNCEDGSMKLFGEEESINDQAQPEIEEVSKDDIVALIEDYTLNPQAIKLIVFKIKYLSTNDLKRIFSQQGGEIAFVIQAELRNRGIIYQTERASSYQDFFMDQSKIYQRLRWNRRNQQRQFIIPELSAFFTQQWLSIVLRMVSQNRISNQSQRIANFCKKIMLQPGNAQMITSQCLQVLQMDNSEFQLKYQQSITFDNKLTSQNYKHALVDHIFGMMIEQRLGLPIIFYGLWNPSLAVIQSKNVQKSEKSTNIIQILLQTVLNSNVKESIFLKNVWDYMNILSKVTKFQYPYLQLQDSLSLSQKLISSLSEKMHQSHQTFQQNSKYFNVFKIVFYLHVNSFQQFLKLQLFKITEVVKKVYSREDAILQIFRKNYGNEDGVELQRKAEIYWQLRKSKNGDEFNQQLVFCRKLLTDMSSIVLQQLKQNCFIMYYKGEDLKLRDELAYLKRKIAQTKNYSQKYQLQSQFNDKQQKYNFWRKNLINLIIVEEINPAIDSVSSQFIEQVRKTTTILTELYSIFHTIAKTTPILFKLPGQFYMLMLAIQLMKKEEEQNYHSLSLLKTLPSIQSTRQMAGGRRRSSLLTGGRLSIFQANCFDLPTILKKSAQMLSCQSLLMSQKDVLFGMHARNADTQTKIKYIRQMNRLGDKVIQVSRDSMWSDTFPHLDQTFGDYDIKIKIKGELGIDYGGVTREWITLLVKEITDPKLGLFQLNVNQLAFQPSKFSYLVPNHLQIFKRFGILVGKAMKQGWLLQVNFTKSFLKHMLGALLYVEDLQDIQPSTAKSLLWILKNYVDQDLCLNFTYEEQVLETKRLVELIPGGSEVFVNELNKKEYVKKLAYTKMTENIRQQSMSFIEGIQKVIPLEMLKLFNYRQIGKYLAGASTIDVPEMKKYAKYEGYSQDSETVKWFWQIMQAKSEQDRAQFMFFLTGSYRVPYSGFRQNPITINKMPACKDYLPVAHTCFSIIDMPEYSSPQKMQLMLTKAFKQGKGFTVS